MPPALAARKRKATERSQNDGSDSDTIVVAPARNGDISAAKPARSPLKEVTSNKRQRVLDRVAIPVHDGALSDAAITPHSQSPASVDGETEAGAERVASAKPALKSARGKKEDKSGLIQGSLSKMWGSSAPKSSPGTSNTVAKTPVSQPKPQTSSRGPKPAVDRVESKKAAEKKTSDHRPRRSTAPVTFVSSPALEASSDEDDEDEPVRSATRARGGAKAQRRNNDDDDDFGEKEQSSSAEEEEELEEEQSDVEMSDDPVSDANASDEESKTAKGKKAKAVAGKKSDAKPDAKRTANDNKKKASSKMMTNLTVKRTVKGLDSSLPPLSDTSEMFADLTTNALRLGLDKVTKSLAGRRIRVATMCSGTESPLLALQMVQDVLRDRGLESIQVEHIFSAEIVPYKQAYIERNFAPPIIFRDITEFTAAFEGTAPSEDDVPSATTAYGSRVAIPTEVDIVVAGTSCVDYSKLNNKKKPITGDGESGRTWFGALAYCKVSRPAIIIFENVKGADWDAMLGYYRDIGYESEGVLVDSKDYYMPHTRQRGYMVCFDITKLKQGGDGIGKRWQKLMTQLKRYASSSVSEFLLPNDQIVMRNLSEDSQLREVDWAQCEIRQMKTRQSEKLGTARPVTHWQESGQMIVPERGVRVWYTRQVERVKDTMDALVLRGAQRSLYDLRYKTFIVNLSQNLDRITIGSPGIIGCITPTGIFFVTDANRILSAEETLLLQGLPLEVISFTTETQAELLDLAGNAMTSTVVGSALLAALITGHEVIASSPQSSVAPRTAFVQQEVVLQPMAETAEISTYQSKVGDIEPKEILRQAIMAARQCFCEGTDGLCAKPIQECVDCNHTICITCGGNPPHNYRQLPKKARLQPSSFVTQLKAVLPLQLAFTGEFVLAASKADAKVDFFPRYESVIRSLNGSVYSFHSIRRTFYWTATYTASHSRLELVIDGDRAEWRLFATPARELASNDPLRLTLAHDPVAKAAVSDSLLPTSWHMRVPVDRSISLKVRAAEASNPTWWARCGLPEHLNDTQAQEFEVAPTTEDPNELERSLSGTYRYLPRCGKASDSLYRKVDSGKTKDSSPIFLYLDPTRTRDVEEDVFVFSHHIPDLDYDEVRPLEAYIKAPWRPWPTKGKASTPKVMISGEWASVEGLRLGARPMELQMRSSLAQTAQADNHYHCGQAVHVFRCTVPQAAVGMASATMNVTNNAKFISEHIWVFEAMHRQIGLSDWILLPSAITEKACISCAPPRPQVRWKLESDKNQVKPFEDPRTAAVYERAIKSRAQPFIVMATTDGAQNHLDVGVNVATLAHRAASRLPHGGSMAEVKWRLDTDNAASGRPRMPKLKLRASDDVKPFTGQLKMTVDLFPNQRRVLAWMLKQESGVDFSIEEAEEAVVPSAGWRAEVRVSVPLKVHGGICADHPGFGKTITSLALIQAQYLECKSADIRKNLSARRDSLAPGRRVSSATLIVCPGTLVQQWHDEIADKLRYTEGVITIFRQTDIDRHQISDFENAKIILMNRSIFSSDTYVERLATFAATSGPANKTGGRAFAKWLQYATDQIPEHLGIMNDSGLQALKQHINSKFKQHVESASSESLTMVPSRRLHGKDYAAQNGKPQVKKQKTTSTSLNTANVHRPLFEMFYFNRVIIDEFHQFENKELHFLSSLKADKRWGLSGTPALDDLYDVAQLASIIGVPLRVGSDARGVMTVKNIARMRADLTDFERFDAMRVMPSTSMHDRLCETHQLFLETFVRRNWMDFAEMRVQNCLHPATLDLDHCALYTELSQHLNSSDMRIKRGKKGGKDGKTTDREDRLYRAMNTSNDGEEALSKTAAASDSAMGLDAAVKVREEQVKETLRDLRHAIAAARLTEPEPFQTWKQSIDANDLKDEGTITAIKGILTAMPTTSNAAAIKPKPKSAKRKRAGASEDEDEEVEIDDGSGDKKKGTSPLTSDVNIFSKRLVVANRSLRYLHNVQRIQQHVTDPEARLEHCQSVDCKQLLQPEDDIAVSAFCGHSVCKRCYARLREMHNTHCPEADCSCSMEDYHLLWKSKMGDLDVTQSTPYGAKLDKAIDLIEHIREKHEQVILFIQYATQFDEVARALEDRQLPSLLVKDTGKAAAQVKQFQEDRDSTLIVLNASDETAAGLNLQNANHVIFLSPLLRDTQYAYEATMAQGVGRVRRHGQTRQIFVHRTVALNTIDVDILEHRERRTDAIAEFEGPAISAPSTATIELESNGKPKEERCQLVKIDGKYSLQPHSWLCGGEDSNGEARLKGRSRVSGWTDYSAQVKFTRAYTEDDE
ncbi:hypothetical protein LTS10_004207 [Elasticomyces elasticus]|nr:hypothetical protein LTS10_004207 [Elasticomyces elasticus]